LTLNIGAGFVLIVAGSWLATRGSSSAPPATVEYDAPRESGIAR
jgi:hypothetical protein